MSQSQARRVLDVGQCNMDHGNISAMLSRQFDVSIERAAGASDAMDRLRSGHFDLVLVNRIFDADADSGLDFIREVRADSALASVPLMLVSNYADAQEQAAALGAVPGFGKAALYDPDTKNRLSPYLA